MASVNRNGSIIIVDGAIAAKTALTDQEVCGVIRHIVWSKVGTSGDDLKLEDDGGILLQFSGIQNESYPFLDLNWPFRDGLFCSLLDSGTLLIYLAHEEKPQRA